MAMRRAPPRLDRPAADATLIPRARVREQRRMTLEIRTLTVSLRGALADLDIDPTLSTEERVLIRRGWCERVAILLQDIRVRSMRIQRLTNESGPARSPMQMLDAADADLANLRDPARGMPGDGRVSRAS
jgi:hypothetical protein